MNLVYGALLLHSAGKEINEANVKKVAESVGGADEAQIKALVAALDGVNIKEIIEKAAMPAAAAPVSASVSGAATVAEEKKEEDTEKKAEEAAAGLGALFG